MWLWVCFRCWLSCGSWSCSLVLGVGAALPPWLLSALGLFWSGSGRWLCCWACVAWRLGASLGSRLCGGGLCCASARGCVAIGVVRGVRLPVFLFSVAACRTWAWAVVVVGRWGVLSAWLFGLFCFSLALVGLLRALCLLSSSLWLPGRLPGLLVGSFSVPLRVGGLASLFLAGVFVVGVWVWLFLGALALCVSGMLLRGLFVSLLLLDVGLRRAALLGGAAVRVLPCVTVAAVAVRWCGRWCLAVCRGFSSSRLACRVCCGAAGHGLWRACCFCQCGLVVARSWVLGPGCLCLPRGCCCVGFVLAFRGRFCGAARGRSCVR
ncbi:hypothetical protein SAMN03159300_10481 [Janthinobacterium sp. 344]|nr:hypothetical protein SAMN03159300_10481 [Janthinobacterium sp. 344]